MTRDDASLMRGGTTRARGDPRARPALALVLGALCGGLAAAPAAADGAALGGGGAIRITAEPRQLAPGSEPVAKLRIAVPAGVNLLAVTANAGAVEAVTRTAEGEFTARYLPPPERIPRIAIVAAAGRTAAGEFVDGWLAIPIHGHGRARIVATPGSVIRLRIGDRDFGPVRADEHGRAIVPVVVPPGVREGHHGFRPVDLGVPETSLVHAVADRDQVPAGSPSEVRFRAYVVAPHGAVRAGDLPQLEASRGTVAFEPREPGAIAGVWRLPPGTAGEARLVVSLPGAPASRSVLRVDAVAPPTPPVVAARGVPASPSPKAAPAPARDAALLLSGAIVQARGHAGASFAIAVERAPSWLDARLPLRLEGRLAGWSEPGPDPALAAVLAGVAPRRALSPRTQAWAFAGLGFAASRVHRDGDTQAALRPAAALSAGIGRRASWGTPFVEAGVLGAGALVPGGGPAAALTLGLGLRFDLPRRSSGEER